ncbi:MAG TPA: hypothetical protein VMR74_06525 [Gammaproteobacteria bacterium]|nr:hypothetical protein [Gammaproteobacteria bacterium]
MLSRLLSWLGWESAPPPRSRPSRAPRPRSATAHLFEKKPTQDQKSAQTDGDFNPYNTGKFDRSASWDRISKNQR